MRELLKVLLWIVVVLGAILGVLYETVFDVWTVPADDPAMTLAILPTLHPGDVVVFSREYGVKRGNLAICPDPQAPGRRVVARPLATEHEKIELRGEKIYVDGRGLPNASGCAPVHVADPETQEDVLLSCSTEELGGLSHDTLRTSDPAHAENVAAVEIEPGKAYFVSDDRHYHVDSRDYGQIPLDSCQHVVFRLWGLGGSGRLTPLW